MIRLRTEIEPLRHEGTIDHATKMVMVGSCFTDEVGLRLRHALYDVDINPFGTLYNPESMAAEIEGAIDLRLFSEGDLFAENGRYRTFRRHSAFSSPDSRAMLDGLNSSLSRTRQALLEADVLMLTFGSSILFRHTPSGEVVANCHKQDSRLFVREMMTAQEIARRIAALLRRLKSLNPRLKTVLTISPVRHVGYGLAMDRLSKSTLCVACHEIVRLIGDDAIYFPSYEILVDDLRDYRFYKDDLAHPSAMAVEYVYDIFCRSFMTPGEIDYAHRCEKLTRGLRHRPSTDGGDSDFRSRLLNKAERLAEESRYKDLILQRFQNLSINDIDHQ